MPCHLRPIALIAACAALFAGPSRADLRMTTIFSDHMVLQREMPVPVWGVADPGEKVTVTLGAATAEATADAKGAWMARLPALAAEAKGRDLVVAGKSTLTFKDVIVGDVWIASGQSNMEWGLGGCNAPEDIAAADLPAIRRIKVDHRSPAQASDEVPGRWEVCTPASAPGFTAVGFYFASRLWKETGIPMGIIDSNWGGTRIEPWIPAEGFALEPSLGGILEDLARHDKDYRQALGQALDALERWIAAARAVLDDPARVIPPQPGIPGNPLADAGSPKALYNGMIHPIAPYAIKGSLWYQGESNGGEGDEYFAKMGALIGGWRKVWGQGEFPFYFVQLANWQGPNQDPAGGDGWARVRMAQLKSLRIPGTGMAVATDIGEAGDIHPRNKFDVGERLARWALRDCYGKKDLVVSGPLYRSLRVDGGKIRIAFDHVGGGLMVGQKDGRAPTREVAGGTLARFAVAGEDRKWRWAQAVIEGSEVVVSSAEVSAPVAVRYAYSMNPAGANLYNREGLPASPFRTDSW